MTLQDLIYEMHSLCYHERMLLMIQGYFWSLFIAAVPSDGGTYLCLTWSQIMWGAGGGITIYYLNKKKNFGFARLRAMKKWWNVDCVWHPGLCRIPSQRFSFCVASISPHSSSFLTFAAELGCTNLHFHLIV